MCVRRGLYLSILARLGKRVHGSAHVTVCFEVASSMLCEFHLRTLLIASIIQQNNSGIIWNVIIAYFVKFTFSCYLVLVLAWFGFFLGGG